MHFTQYVYRKGTQSEVRPTGEPHPKGAYGENAKFSLRKAFLSALSGFA